jgi:hypothetical protein
MIVEKQVDVDWQGKPKFSKKTCPSATFVHHKIPILPSFRASDDVTEEFVKATQWPPNYLDLNPLDYLFGTN